jgi:hypothetical protein
VPPAARASRADIAAMKNAAVTYGNTKKADVVAVRGHSGCSFDHLIGSRKQRRRHAEAEHPGGPGVEHQLELARLHDRQVRGLGALEADAR